MSIPSQILQWFQDPSHWVQGCWGKNAEGREISFDETDAEDVAFFRRDAVCTCLHGAILKFGGGKAEVKTYHKALTDLGYKVQNDAYSDGTTIAPYQDSPTFTHADLLKVCKAVANA